MAYSRTVGGITVVDESDGEQRNTHDVGPTWHPQRCGMPELTVPSAPMALWAVLTITLAGCGPRDGKSRVLFTNFARLIDHAVREYRAARDEFLAYVNAKPDEQLGQVFVVQSHLETCVNALFRASRFAEKMCRGREGPPIKRGELLPKQAEKRLRWFRDTQEHLESAILKEESPPSSARTVCVLDEGVRVAEQAISYVELRDWITTLHRLAERLARTREEPS